MISSLVRYSDPFLNQPKIIKCFANQGQILKYVDNRTKVFDSPVPFALHILCNHPPISLEFSIVKNSFFEVKRKDPIGCSQISGFLKEVVNNW